MCANMAVTAHRISCDHSSLLPLSVTVHFRGQLLEIEPEAFRIQSSLQYAERDDIFAVAGPAGFGQC